MLVWEHAKWYGCRCTGKSNVSECRVPSGRGEKAGKGGGRKLKVLEVKADGAVVEDECSFRNTASGMDVDVQVGQNAGGNRMGTRLIKVG